VKLLLDTHAFLWWIADDERLSSKAAALIADGTNEVFFSAASARELVVKAGLGRVKLPDPIERSVPGQLARNGFQALPIQLRHVLTICSLPSLRRDPFDRMLVAQTVAEGMMLVSGDRAMNGYPVHVEW